MQSEVCDYEIQFHALDVALRSIIKNLTFGKRSCSRELSSPSVNKAFLGHSRLNNQFGCRLGN